MVRHLRTLGTLALYEQGDAAREDAEPLLSHSKSLALLAYVALAPGRESSRGHLARLLWPEAGRTQARRSLRQALYYLSKRAGRELLRAEDDAVAVMEEALEVDAWAFERALREGRLEEAVALYDGEFLGGFGSRVGREFESWVEAQNERTWSGLKAAYHELVNRSIERGDLEGAVRFGRAYVDLNPFDEAAQSTLVGALLARGDRVAAYQQYESFRTLLEEELDEEPDPGLTDRIEQLQAEIFASRDVGDLVAVPQPGERATAGSDRAPREEATEAASGLLAPGPFRWALTGALAATLVFALIAAVQWLPADEAAGAPGWKGADGAFHILHGADGDRLSEVRVEDGVAEVRPTDLSPSVMLAPGGALAATGVPTDSGPDLVVWERASGEVVARATERADEHPLAWSPDARQLAYERSVRLKGDREYRKQLRVLRVADGSTRWLEGRYQHRYSSWVTWSPLGGRIAYVGAGADGDKDVFVVDVDGARNRNLSRHPAVDEMPAWSPDGRRIAFASNRAGDFDLYLVSPARPTEVERLTYGPRDEVAPTWLDTDVLAFASVGEEGTAELMLLDLTSRNTRRIAGPISDLRANRARNQILPSRWLETLAVVGGDATLGVGETTRFHARATTRSGDSLPVPDAPVRWTSLDRSLAKIDSTGRATALRAGRTSLVASYGGWRADTIRLEVGETVVRRDLALLVEEEWERGIDERAWLPYGQPPPDVVELRDPGAGGMAARALDPNGDANYLSGVVLREPASLEGGLTLEIEARVPITGQLYQVLRAGLHTRETVEGRQWEQLGPGLAEMKVGGDPPSNSVVVDGESSDFSLPEQPGRDHVYAVQVEPSGHVSYVLDGRRLWRSSEPAIQDMGREVYVKIAGQSLHAEVAVREVRLWRGVRYVVGDPPERAFRIAPRRTRGSDDPRGR